MITLRNIQKVYPNGFCAIKNLNLHVAEGDIFGVIGYSGAGKSTLIRLINRLEEPTSGEVLIQGKNILKFSSKELQKQRQKIGMIFQHFNLLSSKNVFENIAYALKIARWDKARINGRVHELLEIVGLSDKAGYHPSQLSGGQKQRVAIARALANYPKILLCDEATSALDTQSTASILDLLKTIQLKLKITIVLITHQIEVVKSICNKICVIDKGNVVEKGLIEKVFVNPQSPITKQLISHLPQYDSKRIEVHVNDPENTYELTFFDRNQNQPVISDVIKEFNIDVNILFADYSNFSNNTWGSMIAHISGDRVGEAIDWLEAHNVDVRKYQEVPKDSKDRSLSDKEDALLSAKLEKSFELGFSDSKLEFTQQERIVREPSKVAGGFG